MMRQPMRSRVRTNCATIAVTTRTTKLNGRAQDRSGADEIPDVGFHVARGDLHGIDLQQKFDDRAYERQHDERGQERPQPEKADQEAVDQADQRADANCRDDRRLNRPFRDVDQRQSGEIGQREVRADAEIDAAGQHDDRHADHDQSEFADLPRRVGEVSGRKEIGNGWP